MKRIIFCLTWLMLSGWCFGETLKLDSPVGPEGHLFCRIQTPENYQSGRQNQTVHKSLLELPDVGSLYLELTPSTVAIGWSSKKTEGPAPVTEFLLPDLPAGEYAVQVSWDSTRGILNAYLNDMPLRDADTVFSAWIVTGAAAAVQIMDSDIQVRDVHVEPRFCPEAEALQQIPEHLKGFPSYTCTAAPLDVKKGALLYQSTMTAANDLSGWIMEGPGEATYDTGWMRMRSANADGSQSAPGHIVYWCPQDFPDRFVAEWDVVHESEYGLLIIFFAAIGQNGKDIFDPSQPVRDGRFSQYTRGKISSYHISYYGNTTSNSGRQTCNLRKNPPSYLCTQGDVPIRPGDQNIAHIRLIKDGNHIQMQRDGKVYLDFIDDNPERLGPAYGGGKIGFRQMQWSRARYRNFNIWEIQ